MSIFAGLQSGGIKGPDVVINGDGGSLLPTSSGLRFSSAKINQTPSLMAGINPYDYGPGSTSDDIAYGVTPHKIQKIVPPLSIPSDSANIADDNFTLSHPVDDGDMAFTIRIVHDMATRLKNWSFMAKQNLTRAVDPIINICTVNYILRGLQTPMGDNDANWANFLMCTGWPIGETGFELHTFRGGEFQHRNLSMFIQDYIRPLGVVIGSEMQGGQHQGGGAVDFPVDFVVTILVDGLCDNMLNVWRRTEIRAGDDLFFALCGTQVTTDHRPTGGLPYQFSKIVNSGLINENNFIPPSVDTSYVLNHWAQGQVTARFTNKPKLLFELVPTTSTEINEGVFLCDDRKNRGLWHVARSQVHIRGCPVTPSGKNQTFRQDTANLRGGGLVQATIAPVWKSATKHHDVSHGLHHVVWVGLEHELQAMKAASVAMGLPSGVSPHAPLSVTSAIPTAIPTATSTATLTASATHAVNNTNATSSRITGTVGGIIQPVVRQSNSSNTDSLMVPNKRAATEVRVKKSVMEPMDIDSTFESGMTDVQDPKVSKVSKENTLSKVHARSATGTSGEAGSRSVSVARVSAKKRADVES
jgi:hypothetical protein